ncbi:NADP-dependent oxidoreductase [Saccharopolyspora rhizosphaerae]|uniref:NADP-dependent oxidoreductase n=1 Tax=Saccharopolyspora rhizosphaerae TaxID=2492662 RepID=A0A426K4I5_9PSEU|nr:NADP-dependent oxidoreductase [Saccharopolyspora rhizosphaerae]RRO20416.1 NADP-dependent oxidoreductase [Saccharopolyspora rhizosphaerae]
MRVLGFTEFGGPEVLGIHDVPERHAGPGEVRVRVRAAAVNPTDTAGRAGWFRERYRELEPPYVPGMDAAGVIDEIGEGTETDLQVGDDVMAIVIPEGSHGAYSESLVLPAASVARAPKGTDHATASTLPMNGLTARLALDLLALPPGSLLAVTGAAGTLGGYVVQLAKAEGLRVIADAKDSDRELVAELGADEIVERGEDVATRIREVAPDGVDAVVDAAVLNDKVEPAVRDGGAIATVRFFTADAERGIQYHPVLVRDYWLEREKLDRLREQAEDGTLTLRVADVYPAERGEEAQRRLEAGGTRGRLVLEF